MHAVVYDEAGEMVLLDPVYPGADLAGGESFRQTVWGSTGMRALGARYFPVLDGDNLTVAPEHVADFLRECAMVAEHLEDVAPHDCSRHSHEWYLDSIPSKLANIRATAEHALAAGGGVLIW